MEDVIGYGGAGWGYDIIGARAPAGVPPYGYGFPAGQAYYPYAQHGFGNVDPFTALAAAQAMAQAAPNAMAPAAPDNVAGWGPGAAFGPAAAFNNLAGFDGGCGLNPLVAPLLIQQNKQEALGLAPRCPTLLQTQYVGFEACDLGPCETVTLRCSPCVAMKIIRFVIPWSVASQIQVDQITVNGKWQLINCGPVPGEMFVPDSTIPDVIATETIQPGCCVEIQVTNISNASLHLNIGGIARVAY